MSHHRAVTTYYNHYIRSTFATPSQLGNTAGTAGGRPRLDTRCPISGEHTIIDRFIANQSADKRHISRLKTNFRKFVRRSGSIIVCSHLIPLPELVKLYSASITSLTLSHSLLNNQQILVYISDWKHYVQFPNSAYIISMALNKILS